MFVYIMHTYKDLNNNMFYKKNNVVNNRDISESCNITQTMFTGSTEQCW